MSRYRGKLLILVGLVIFTIFLIALSISLYNFKEKISCYNRSTSNTSSSAPIVYFEDILDAKKQPIPGKTIFFHETSCTQSGIVQINSK